MSKKWKHDRLNSPIGAKPSGETSRSVDAGEKPGHPQALPDATGGGDFSFFRRNRRYMLYAIIGCAFLALFSVLLTGTPSSREADRVLNQLPETDRVASRGLNRDGRLVYAAGRPKTQDEALAVLSRRDPSWANLPTTVSACELLAPDLERGTKEQKLTILKLVNKIGSSAIEPSGAMSAVTDSDREVRVAALDALDPQWRMSESVQGLQGRLARLLAYDPPQNTGTPSDLYDRLVEVFAASGKSAANNVSFEAAWAAEKERRRKNSKSPYTGLQDAYEQVEKQMFRKTWSPQRFSLGAALGGEKTPPRVMSVEEVREYNKAFRAHVTEFLNHLKPPK